MALRRLTKELGDLRDGLEFGEVAPIEGDMFHWQGHINGPADTPYEGARIPLHVTFPQDYPFKPPVVKFTCTMLHPNVNEDGVPCANYSKEWRPATTIRLVLQEIYSLVASPNLEQPVNAAAAQLLQQNPAQYDMRVRELVRKFM
eukprot:TRINITY_DN1784_c0_g2_i1.p1 TRINITY_DN1784_c0_g2~~TRINITY_DN1784_c0_g2_i1.p1  ORF type:complete len:145 (-),score=25.84 TRINITY_DN1784_c0_g2_i1:553-987(-)